MKIRGSCAPPSSLGPKHWVGKVLLVKSSLPGDGSQLDYHLSLGVAVCVIDQTIQDVEPLNSTRGDHGLRGKDKIPNLGFGRRRRIDTIGCHQDADDEEACWTHSDVETHPLK